MRNPETMKIFLANASKEYEVVAKHPEMFSDLISMEVGVGWQPIVDKVLLAVAEIEPEGKILQVKEKFGGLRIYHDFKSKRAELLIEGAVNRAKHTCEDCGVMSNDVKNDAWGSGWFKTLCEECGAKRKHAYEERTRRFEEFK